MGINAVFRPVVATANILGGIIGSTEKLDKVSKLFISISDGFQLLFSGEWIAPIGSLRGRLESFSKVVSAVNLINRIKEWVCVDEALKGTPNEGKRFWQVKYEKRIDKAALWFKIGNRITLTIGQAIDTLKFIDAMGLLKLGKIASFAVRNIPLLNLVQNGAILISAGCNITCSGIKLHKSQAVYNNLKSKQAIWKDISEFYSSNTISPKKHAALENKLIAKLTAKYKETSKCDDLKKVRYDSYLKNLENGLDSFVKAKPVVRHRELTAKARMLQEEMENCIDEPVKSKKLNKEHTFIRGKIDRTIEYSRYNSTDETEYLASYKFGVYDARATNLSRDRNKSWLAIANDVVKIAIIFFSTLFLALSLASLPFTLTLWAIGFAVSIVGMKFLYDDFYKEKRKEPIFIRPSFGA